MWTSSHREIGMNTRDFKRLYERCLTLVHSLRIPTPFDVEKLCANLDRDRNRQIQLLPMVLPPGSLSGLWLSTNNIDYIVYQKATSLLHQQHIILHEIGHLICEHGATSALDTELPPLLFPDLDPRKIREVLGRSHYTCQQEQEAEMVASIILQQAKDFPGRSVMINPDEPTEVVKRIERSLGSVRRESI